MTLHLDFYISMRSPFSYLVTPRLVALERDYDVAITAKPVYAIAARDPNWFSRINPLWVPYFARDRLRTAEYLGVPFAAPRPDPIVQNLETGELAAEQPYIHRLTRLTAAATEQGQGFPFVCEVSALIFDGSTEDWHEGSHLADAAARAGVDMTDLVAAIEADPGHFDAIIEANQTDQEAAGHWGTPLMVFEGEPFFGQDRFDMLKWRMEQKGLARR